MRTSRLPSSGGRTGGVPRVLLVLSRRSYRAQAFLAAARRLGVDVTVVSDHRASLGDRAPDTTLRVRFDDEEASLARIETFVRRVPVHGVVAAEDDGVMLAARVARTLGLRHGAPEAVRLARNKALFRMHTRDAAWSVPRFRVVAADETSGAVVAEIPFPCVLKPLSLSASRGVIRADDAVQFRVALERVRRILASEPLADGRVLVEDFLPGREVALEGLLTDGRLATLALLDKPDPMDGPFFEETILVTPSRLPQSAQVAVAAAVQAAAAAVGLDQGPVHAEARVNGGEVRLLELAPRSIGGRCSRILRFSGGRTLEEVLLSWALGHSPQTDLDAGAAGVMMLPIPGRGTLTRIRGVERARLVPGVEDIEITLPLGHRVVPLPEGHQYLGFLFARGASPEGVVQAIRRSHGYLRITLEDGREGTTVAARAHGER